MTVTLPFVFLAQRSAPFSPPTYVNLLPMLCIGIFGLGIMALMLFVWGTIFKKAGYSPWFALLMFVPIANLVWILVFAFSKWPIQQELENLRGGRGFTGGFPVGPPR